MIDYFLRPVVRLIWRKDYKAYHPDTMLDWPWVRAALPGGNHVAISMEDVDKVLSYVSQFGYALETVGGPEEDV